MIATVAISVAIVYLLVVLGIGYYAWKKTKNTPEDFFMASRSFGTLSLMWAAYATNMTAVYLMGFPGMVYRGGIGAYGYMSVASVIGVSFLVYFIGYRIWLLGKARGYMTPTEIWSRRWDSEAIKIVVFLMLFVFTIVYAMTGLQGVGLATEALTENAIPFWVGTIAAAAIILIYTVMGGMRGTVWTNILQGFLFHLFVILAVILIAIGVGGVDAMTNKLLNEAPKLLAREGNFTPQQWFSWLLIPPMAVIAFPHVFIRYMVGKSHVTLKRYTWLYAVLHITGWIPVALIGLWGRSLFPGLTPVQSDAIVPMMAAQYLHPVLAGFALAAVLAVVMSTIDAMMLTLSALFTRDILTPYTKMSPSQQTRWARILLVVFAVISVLGALTRPATIFAIAAVAFTGFVMLIPMMFAGLYWKRSTKWGILAGLVVSCILLPIYFFTPALKWSEFGFMPIVPMLVINIVLIVVVSYLTPAPEKKVVAEFFDVLDPIFGRKELEPARAPTRAPGVA